MGFGLGTITMTLAALAAGGVVATATVVGVVSSQTSAPDSGSSPTSEVLEYGSN